MNTDQFAAWAQNAPRSDRKHYGRLFGMPVTSLVDAYRCHAVCGGILLVISPKTYLVADEQLALKKYGRTPGELDLLAPSWNEADDANITRLASAWQNGAEQLSLL